MEAGVKGKVALLMTLFLNVSALQLAKLADYKAGPQFQHIDALVPNLEVSEQEDRVMDWC